jgi:hypothetical protein
MELVENLIAPLASQPRTLREQHRGRYQLLDLVIACHAAAWHQDAVTARYAMTRIPKSSLMRMTSLWSATEAGLALATGNPGKAVKIAHATRKRLSRLSRVGSLRAESGMA